MTLELTADTKVHCKFDEPCSLCPPDRAMMRRLTCEEYQVTQATLKGMGIEREALVCNDCIQDMRDDPKVEVV